MMPERREVLTHFVESERGREIPTNFLTDTELGPITDIECLQAKQKDPAVHCSDKPPTYFRGGPAIRELEIPDTETGSGNSDTSKDDGGSGNGGESKPATSSGDDGNSNTASSSGGESEQQIAVVPVTTEGNDSSGAEVATTKGPSFPSSWNKAEKLGIGNFPNYSDSECNGEGEYLCDPYKILHQGVRREIAAKMRELRETVLVKCGGLLNDKVDPWHYQPFYLGVVLLRNWPAWVSDADSLQQFGRILAAQWNMNSPYTGSFQPYLRCPNTGVLLLIPDGRQVFVSSSSCEFICESRGGPEVVAESLLWLDRKGPATAILMGLNKTYEALSRGSLSQKDKDLHIRSEQKPWEVAAAGESRFTIIEQFIFGTAIIMLGIGIIVGSLVFILAPGMMKARR